MKDGKLSDTAYIRSVLPAVKRINAGRKTECMRTAVVTGNEYGTAYLAVLRAVNAVAAVPAAVTSVAVTISIPRELPEGITLYSGTAPDIAENAVKEKTGEIEAALKGKNITLSDLTVEITENPLITVTATAVGNAGACQIPDLSCTQNIVMAGFTGACGSAMLSINGKERLMTRYTADFLAASDALLRDTDVSESMAAVAAQENYKIWIKPVSDGGIFGALWSICEELGCGCEAYIKSIPIKQATVEVCEFFDINPYMLRGDGAFIYVTDREPDSIACGHVIGQLKHGSDRVVINGDTRSFLTPVREDTYFSTDIVKCNRAEMTPSECKNKNI